MRMNTRTALLCTLAGWLAATAAHAQLDIRITSGVERPVPIAIVPFAWQGSGSAPFDVSGLVTADLGNSGRFETLDEQDMVARPTRGTDVNFRDWRVVDVDSLLIGRMMPADGDEIAIEFQLFDVLRGEQLLGFRLTAARDDLRAAAHRVADMVFEELTGIRGVFSTRIAYVTETENDAGERRYRLIVADADGANSNVIAESSQPLMSPAWSPDGRQLAYVSFEGGRTAIYVQTLRTGSRREVSARAGHNGAPVFSPDGRRLALTLSMGNGNLDVYTLDISNQVLRRITENPAIDTEPAWSNDGESLYFTSDRAGAAQIYRVEAEPGNRAERVTFEGRSNMRPRVAPDGEQLAAVNLDLNGNYRIATVDPANGQTRVLTDGRLDESPSFAPNGASIIYATREGSRGVLASVSTDGRIHQEIASVEGDVREPVWSPFARP